MSSIDWFGTLSLWANIGTLIAAGAAAIALFLNFKAIRESTKTRELQIFYQIFNDILSLEEKYYKEYSTKKPEELKDWLSLFFNTLEYKAFLINKKYLKKDLIEFYKDAFISYYEKIFLKGSSIEDQKNPDK